MKRITLVVVGLAVAMLVGSSCSTKKNTWTSRQYHNLTARFNVNFNAKESFKEAERSVESMFPSTFDELLPVFAFANSDAPNNVMSELDRTITKSQKLIAKHSITAKPKRKSSPSDSYRKFYNKREFCDMVDDAHLSIGKSKMYMQQYDEAAAIFQNIIETYPDENSVNEAKLWLAVVEAARGEIDVAEEGLKALEKSIEKSKAKKNKKEYPSKKLISGISSAWADIYIKKGDYNAAISKLNEALPKVRLKATKVRYNFILAQLYEHSGNKTMANKYYSKVANMNVPYEVEFNALMSKANNMDSTMQVDELREMYTRMLKNEKNFEYADQLHYALGNLERSQGDTAKAKEQYLLSLSKYDGNDIQRGLSSLALANFYYADKEYLPAFNYYDTAYMALANHSQQEYAKSMADRLRVLGAGLATIEREDSLQRIAAMSPEEQQKYATDLAKKAQEEEEQRMQQPLQYYNNPYDTQQGQMGLNRNTQASQWYFYNPTTVNQGASDFKLRWGQRKLEDNWRRKNKNLSLSDLDTEEEQESAEDGLPEGSKKPTGLKPTMPDYYLQDVPATEDELKASNNRLMQAMYNVAVAYRGTMKDNVRALEYFSMFASRFPQSDYMPSVYYNMYELYTQQGELAKAEECKNKLLAEYPNDKLSHLLRNPNYFVELEQKEQQAEQAYDEALAYYRSNNNSTALSLASVGLERYKGLPIEANFALLKVLAGSYENNPALYKQDLQQVVKSYPASSAAAAAKNLLLLVDKEEPTPEADSSVAKPDEPKKVSVEPEPTPEADTSMLDYVQSDNESHILLIVVDKEMQTNQLAFDIALFNASKFLSKNYTLEQERNIDASNKALIVRTFANKDEALSYYNAVVAEPGLLKSTAGKHTCLVISLPNYEVLKKKRSVEGYLQYFNTNYLNK